MTTVNELKSSPMLYLSGGSKELFHSNFLYWLGMNYRNAFQELMNRMCLINAPWPDNWTIRREHKHLDLCVTYKKETGKTRKGKSVSKECAFIIVENKVKSLPDLLQLRKYEQVYDGHDSGCTYAVLSLLKDLPGQKYLNENTCWQIHHYDELAELLAECFSDDKISQEHKLYLRDYCKFISNLSNLAEGWKIDMAAPFLSSPDDLYDLRLNDVYEKVRYAQIASILAEKLKRVLIKDTDEDRIVLGMTNIDVILRRRDDADEILYFYGCPEAKPFGQVFIGSGMSHGVGLVEAKVKIAEDCCFVIQVQGNHYCHCIECENITQKKLSEPQSRFLDFKTGGLNNGRAKSISSTCSYQTGFLYKWQKIQPSNSVEDIVEAIYNDLIEIKELRGE